MNRTTLWTFALAAVITCQGVARADGEAPAEWPQFKRDSARTGDNPRAKLTFPLTRTTAIRFPSPIYASPAVIEGRVYIQDARGHVACIEAAKNSVLWKAEIGGTNNTSSPAVVHGKVYVGSTGGELHILSATTGESIAKVPAGGPVVSSPAVGPNGVYFSSLDGKLHKITPEGKLVWSFDGGRLSPVDFAVRERRLVFFAGSENTIFHELEDEGEQVRIVKQTPAPRQCCPVSGPVLMGETEFAFQSFDSESGRFYRFRGEEKPIVVTDLHEGRGVPSVRGDRVYRGDKCWSGDKTAVAWRADPAVLYDGGFHSSPALGDDFLVVGSEHGSLYFFPLDSKGRQKPIFEYTIGTAGEPNGAVSSSPAVVDGQVFFGGEDGVLYGLGQAEAAAPIVDAGFAREERPATRLAGAAWPTVGGDMGLSGISNDRVIRPPLAPLWKVRVWSAFKCPLIVAENKVFCTGRGGTITALDAAGGEIVWKIHHPGVESRPPVTYVDGKLVLPRIRNAQGDSPYASGGSGGPPGEGIWCHDAATGKFRWHVPMAFKYHFNHDCLVAHEGRVFAVRFDDEKRPVAVAHALDDGREVWRTPLEEHLGDLKEAPKTSSVKPGPGLPPRFSGVMAEGLWCVSICDRGTLAIEPASGKVVWTAKDHAITNRTRLAARRGVVMVYTAEAGQAFNAKTGAPLWADAAGKTGYTQALSDAYLDSEGKLGLFPKQHCSWPVLVNGVVYSHERAGGTNHLLGLAATDLSKTWSYSFLSNACPSPSPAYGRLYYSPHAEGVIYCFANEAPQQRAP